LLFKLFVLMLLVIVVSRVFHLGRGKHWKLIGDSNNWSPFSEKTEKVICEEENVCLKTFKFGSVDNFGLRNLIEPVKGCKHRSGYTRNYIEVLEGSQGEDVVVEFSFNVTSAAMLKELDIELGEETLLVRYPVVDGGMVPSCEGDFSSWTKVYLRRGISLDGLNVESTSMPINIPAQIDAQVKNAEFKLTAGSLTATPFVNAEVTKISTDATWNVPLLQPIEHLLPGRHYPSRPAPSRVRPTRLLGPEHASRIYQCKRSPRRFYSPEGVPYHGNHSGREHPRAIYSRTGNQPPRYDGKYRRSTHPSGR
jgi:hypothetical protein